MEYWSDGELEYWSDVLFCSSSSVTFLDHQIVRPLSKLSLLLQALHKLQQTIFKFECNFIESFGIFNRNLFGFSVSIKP